MFWKPKKPTVAEAMNHIRQAMREAGLSQEGKYNTFLNLIESDLNGGEQRPKVVKLDVKRLIFEGV